MSDIADIVTLSQIEPDDYPQAVKDAHAFQAEALALLEKAKAAPPVNLEAATTKDIAKVHAAAVARDRDHEIATRHAETLARIAAGRVETAWRGSLSDLAVKLGKQFDAAAETFTTACARFPDLDSATRAAAEHWNPDTADLRESLATLDRLRQCRNLIATTWVVQDIGASSTYEPDSRTLWFESLAVQAPFHSRTVNASREVFYLTAAFTPGVRIQWQTPTQQKEQPAPAKIAKSRAEMDAQIAAQSAAFAARRRR